MHTVGILGGGQLGRMLCLAAKRLPALRLRVLDPAGAQCPAAAVCGAGDAVVTGRFDDPNTVL